MKRIVNHYQLTCEMRTRIRILDFKVRHRRQRATFYCAGIAALLMILCQYYKPVMVVCGGAFLIFLIWMLCQIRSIKTEFKKYSQCYPDTYITVELGEKISIFDENKNLETYDYSSVIAVKETKEMVVMVTYTTNIALIKPILDEANREIKNIKGEIRHRIQ